MSHFHVESGLAGYGPDADENPCAVSLDGQMIGTTDSVGAGFVLLARKMRTDNYFPNVWYVNERGNTTLVSLDVETGSYVFTNTAYV